MIDLGDLLPFFLAAVTLALAESAAAWSWVPYVFRRGLPLGRWRFEGDWSALALAPGSMFSRGNMECAVRGDGEILVRDRQGSGSDGRDGPGLRWPPSIRGRAEMEDGVLVLELQGPLWLPMAFVLFVVGLIRVPTSPITDPGAHGLGRFWLSLLPRIGILAVLGWVFLRWYRGAAETVARDFFAEVARRSS